MAISRSSEAASLFSVGSVAVLLSLAWYSVPSSPVKLPSCVAISMVLSLDCEESAAWSLVVSLICALTVEANIEQMMRAKVAKTMVLGVFCIISPKTLDELLCI